MNFEKQHARWLDGEMNEAEASEFIHRHTLDPLEKKKWSQSRFWIKKATTIAPRHPDFLDASILGEINALSTSSLYNSATPKKLFNLHWLVWSGVSVLILATGLRFFIPSTSEISSLQVVSRTQPDVPAQSLKVASDAPSMLLPLEAAKETKEIAVER